MIERVRESLKKVRQFTKHSLRVILQRFFPTLYKRIVSRQNPLHESQPQWRSVLNGPLQGHELLLHSEHVAHWHQEMWHGSYDAFLYDALRDGRGEQSSLLGATVWDVGSHIGYHTLTFAALVGPTGHVVAFEPNPHNVEHIRRHLERNHQLARRITLIESALGDLDGEDEFIFSPKIENGWSSGSHLARAYAPNTVASYIEKSFRQSKVMVMRGDTLLGEKRVPPPSLIKLDVEGAESLVLAGAKQLLTTYRPTLLIEVHHILAMYEILNILLPLDYHTRLIDQAPTSASRCFVLAQPNVGDYANQINRQVP